MYVYMYMRELICACVCAPVHRQFVIEMQNTQRNSEYAVRHTTDLFLFYIKYIFAAYLQLFILLLSAALCEIARGHCMRVKTHTRANICMRVCD